MAAEVNYDIMLNTRVKVALTRAQLRRVAAVDTEYLRTNQRPLVSQVTDAWVLAMPHAWRLVLARLDPATDARTVARITAALQAHAEKSARV